MSLESIIDYIFDGFMNKFILEIGCKVIKVKLREYTKFINFHKSIGYSTLDMFFDYVFLRHMRPIHIDYLWNIVGLINNLEMDPEFSGMLCRYHKEKIEISELLDKYLIDMFNFFKNRPDIRAYIIIYPMYYRIIKFIIYGFGNSIVNQLISEQINILNYFWTEEELERIHFSKGHALIMLSRNIIMKCMSDFNTKALTKPSHNYPEPLKPSLYSIGEVVNTEIIKRTISELDFDIKLFDGKIDIDKLREQSQTDEQDEMFSFDQHYQNPWNALFISSINILLNCQNSHVFSKNVLDKAKYLTENQFIPVWHFSQMMQQPKNRSMNRDKNEEELLKEYGLIINEKTKHDDIVSNIKYNTWDRPEIIQWHAW